MDSSHRYAPYQGSRHHIRRRRIANSRLAARLTQGRNFMFRRWGQQTRFPNELIERIIYLASAMTHEQAHYARQRIRRRRRRSSYR
jgi:hypothetical protein